MTLPEYPWWPVCKDCGLHTVDPGAPPRYDVLNPDFDSNVQDMSEVGPYDEECFANTITGQHVAEQEPMAE
jgi:hypothetical protein